MPNIDPVPWNIYVRAANDLDVDEMIGSTKRRLSAVLPATIERLQTIAKRLDGRPRDEPSDLNGLADDGVAVFVLVARLELLEQLKRHMTPRPPAVISEAEAMRIADARWKQWDRPYDWWDFTTAVRKLRDDGLVRLRRMPKTQGCRYTFTKPPAEYPNAYRAFRQVADYYRVDLGYEGTSFDGLWEQARGTSGRVVVTAAVARAGRRRAREPEPPLNSHNHAAGASDAAQ
jgi:hypothetical protein